jgi:hypothetical protein
MKLHHSGWFLALILAPLPVLPSGANQFRTSAAASDAGVGAAQQVDTSRRTPAREVRDGVYEAAPWIDADGGPGGAGRVVGSADVLGLSGVPSRESFQVQERLYLVPPPAAATGVGAMFLTFALGDRIPGLGQAVIPTGVVRVERVEAGRAVTARVVRMYGSIHGTDGLIALEPLQMPDHVRPVAIANGLMSEVAWIKGSPLLPSLWDYVVLRAGIREGLHAGDQFTLVRPRTAAPGGVQIPEERIAVVQAVRVGPRGTTAVIIDIRHGAIQVGVPARMTAKMP